ncbi:MAG: flagellar basal body L-ring protein FlgH, partial [Leptospiraceae bacterium]|nr:flagellar basal body L-ring protein FlgH [Leptospiraceae bacterium]
NPYSSGQNVPVGTPIKVLITDNIKAEYFFESQRDENHSIKSTPDKKYVPEIKGFYSDRSVVQKDNGLTKSKNKFIGSLSVLVTARDPKTGVLNIAGNKISQFDNQIYEIRLSGLIAPDDLKNHRSIESDSIANLKIELISNPTKRNLQDPDIKMKTYPGRNGETIPRAELSESEKQQIILQYMKRMLGESK